jgi:DhnA family fructose-bisphosphate aldolase class Ia
MKVPVTIRGITPQAVWDAIERGQADGIGLGRNWWRKKQPAE